MNVTLDLYHPEEMRAFATFLNTTAASLETRHKNTESDLIGALGGGINREPNPVWKNEGGQTEPLVLDEKAFFGEQANTMPVRKRGEPSPGHKRRTKAEIVEDEAAQPTAAAVQPSISTGESRVAPDDEPEVVEQDAADEAAETAKAGAELSHENLRDALGKYVQKFGMDAAQLDGPKLFTLVFKNPAITKISAVPTDQASLRKALDGVNEMLAKNPFDRTPVA